MCVCLFIRSCVVFSVHVHVYPCKCGFACSCSQWASVSHFTNNCVWFRIALIYNVCSLFFVSQLSPLRRHRLVRFLVCVCVSLAWYIVCFWLCKYWTKQACSLLLLFKLLVFVLEAHALAISMSCIFLDPRHSITIATATVSVMLLCTLCLVPLVYACVFRAPVLPWKAMTMILMLLMFLTLFIMVAITCHMSLIATQSFHDYRRCRRRRYYTFLVMVSSSPAVSPSRSSYSCLLLATVTVPAICSYESLGIPDSPGASNRSEAGSSTDGPGLRFRGSSETQKQAEQAGFTGFRVSGVGKRFRLAALAGFDLTRLATCSRHVFGLSPVCVLAGF